MKRLQTAVSRFVKRLFSSRATLPKGAAAGEFLEYQAKAEKGDPEAQFNLGFCYDDGRSVAKDAKEAVKWYRKAAEQDYAPAQFNLGYCYANGQGVGKNKEEAVKWFRRAAEQNYAPAQSNLGYCYDNGRGVEKDIVEAYAWFSIAAKADTDAAESRDLLRKGLTPKQFTDAQKRVKRLRLQIKPAS